MKWNCTIEIPVFSRLVFGALAVGKESYLTCCPDSMNIAILNNANTMYGNITIPAHIEGDAAPMPFDMLKITASMPTSGTLKLDYEDNILKMVAGRTRYRFYQFAEGAVKMPPSPDKVMKDLPNIIHDVPIKDLYEANNKILKLSDLTGSLYKTILSIDNGILSISDKDNDIVTDIECDTAAPSSHVMVSTVYLESLLMYFKKYVDESLTVGMYTPESPMTIRYDGDKGNMFYLLAPIVEAD